MKTLNIHKSGSRWTIWPIFSSKFLYQFGHHVRSRKFVNLTSLVSDNISLLLTPKNLPQWPTSYFFQLHETWRHFGVVFLDDFLQKYNCILLRLSLHCSNLTKEAAKPSFNTVLGRVMKTYTNAVNAFVNQTLKK